MQAVSIPKQKSSGSYCLGEIYQFEKVNELQEYTDKLFKNIAYTLRQGTVAHLSLQLKEKAGFDSLH